MQSVSSAFTAEEKDTTRRIAHNLQVSWKKESTLGNRTFTIGVSTIGGSDVIGINPGAIGSPANYRYFDESDYVTRLAWERGHSMPIGGMTKALAEAQLDNTSGRFLPDYMGGRSELFTAIFPRRPLLISAGFEVGGVDITIPQFAGVLTKAPQIDIRDRVVDLQAADYIDFFQNRFLDRTIMFTGQRTDTVLETILRDDLGMSTAQYELDTGIQIIPFGLFNQGDRFSNIIEKIVQAENGQFYQDEEGVFRFENRQHWDSQTVNKLVLTGQVINAQAPDEDHIINVVEVKGQPREKQSAQLIWQLSGFGGSGAVEIPASGQYELFISFDDPILQLTTPVANGSPGQTSFYIANTEADGTGADRTASIYVKSIDTFAQATKIVFQNTSLAPVYLIALDIWGRPARRTGDVYYRAQRDLSVTAYEERPYLIENDYIQSASWAESWAELILNDFAFPENLQRISIRAIPELQLGDLVSWQGRYWRIFDIKSILDTSQGFIQELTMLQRTITSYFRIGISTIGGSDKIAP